LTCPVDYWIIKAKPNLGGIILSVGVVISDVLENSIASLLGLKKGDILLKINNNLITDLLDYQFFAAEHSLVLEIIKKASGRKIELQINKSSLCEDLGIKFISEDLSHTKQCVNRCIFCFIDQMPCGYRDSLYVKDDDYRHSFVHGNFITLTNIPENTIQKIILMRLSPLNISVHTTNPELRVFMMGNQAASRIMEQLNQLSCGGIDFNVQVVLCPGINDGKQLERTIMDLVSLRPRLKSIGIVPVGLTAFRKDLYKIKNYSEDEANETITKIRKLQRQFLKLFGSRIVFLADEFYLKTGKSLPGYNTYEGFPQLENGIGCTRIFIDEFKRFFRRLDSRNYVISRKKIAIITGISAAPVINQLVLLLKQKIVHLNVEVVPIVNYSFGPTVTVAGLLTGQDLLRELPEKTKQDTLVILPQVMIKPNDEVFLDNITIQELAHAVNREIRVIPSDAKSLVKGLLDPANNMGVI
jgi:putative radical SAM enzyme (TIGR03279 family)